MANPSARKRHSAASGALRKGKLLETPAGAAGENLLSCWRFPLETGPADHFRRSSHRQPRPIQGIGSPSAICLHATMLPQEFENRLKAQIDFQIPAAAWWRAN